MPTRRRILLISLLLAAGVATLGGAATPTGDGWERKLDPFLRRVALGVERRQGPIVERHPALSREALRTWPPFLRARRDRQDPILHVNARVVGDAAGGAAGLSARLAAAGVELRGRAGDIVSLAVPASALEALAGLAEVRWLKAGRRFSLTNETSMGDAYTGARTENVTFGNSGAGVIIAVVDTGIDWTENDFRNNDGTTRVLGIWDQTITDAAHPPPAGFSFGAFYSQADIDDALANATGLLTMDGHQHGTHVAGTAAGNGRHTGNGVPVGTFAGMAPEADLLIVRVFSASGLFCDDCDLVAATQFIDQFAQTAGKPWVGNMSLGDSIGGAHDGTSPDELAIDAVIGAGKPGAQMAIAAGNEGRTNRHFHWSGALAAGQTFTNTFNLSAAGGRLGDENDFVWIDLWYEGPDNATIEIQTPGAVVVSAAKGADSGIVCTTSGAVQIDATNDNDPENGDNQVFIQLWDSASCAPVIPPATGTWTIRVITNSVGAGSHSFHAWNATDTPKASSGWVDFTTFDLASSVAVPGTARNALTAGAFVSKGTWLNALGGSTTACCSTNPIGVLSVFSSIGPTRDGRIKPDLAAPGEWIASSPSSAIGYNQQFVERDGVHHNIRGTSMATPHLAGAMALLLGINSDLDGAQIRTALKRVAIADAQTGAVPNNLYGWGRLRVLEGAYEASALVTDLQAGATPGGFAWTGAPTIDSWNVYRAAIPGLSASNYGACLLSGLPAPTFTDASAPPIGTAFAYFVTGVYTHPTTSLPIEGSLGTNSAGATRANNSPCP